MAQRDRHPKRHTSDNPTTASGPDEESRNDAWTWTTCALVLVVILTPALTQSLMSGHGGISTLADYTNGLSVAPAALVAAILLYAAWRVSAATSPPWLLAALVMYAIKTAGLAGLQLSDPGVTHEYYWWIALIDTVQLAGVIGLAACDRCAWFRRAPLVWGAAAGLALTGLRFLFIDRLPAVDAGAALTAAAVAANVVLAAAVVWLVLHRGPADSGIRLRVAGAVVLLVSSRLIETVSGSGQHAVAALAALVTALLGAALLVECALAVLRQALKEQTDRSGDLEQKLVAAETEGRLHRARMHELESAIAGITSASALVRDPGRIPAVRRNHLEQMIQAELHRLERLLRGGHLEAALVDGGPDLGPDVPHEPDVPDVPDLPDEFDLDGAVSTIALAHLAKGTRVSWSPSGRRVAGRPDDVVEVLNILLDNAARHGGREAAVAIRESPNTSAMVEVLVSDSGPGVAPEVRDRLFQWGARAAGSPGQGIGLHLAHRLMSRRGGYVQLDDSRGGGATFVVGIPLAASGVVAGR